MYPYIHIFGKTFGSYGIMIALGCILAAVAACIRGKRARISKEDIFIVGGMSIGMALVCGGVLYILVTYSLAEIWAFICAGDFSFLSGGLVFYGGLIGGIIGAVLGVRLAKCDLKGMEYCVVPFIPLGHAVGRVGCVLAGCCHGMEYDGPLALYYPNAVSGLSPTQGYFPVQLLEAVLNIGICVYLCYYSKKERAPFLILLRYLILYAVARFFLEMLRGDGVRGIYYGLSVSQWISVVSLLTAVGLTVFIQKLAKRDKFR